MNFTRQLLMEHAVLVWKLSEGSVDEKEILTRVTDYINSVDEAAYNSLHWRNIREMPATVEGQLQIVSFHNWAKSGFPVITMGHKYAAALLVTTATEDAVMAARPPFDAFVIEVPDRLLEIRNPYRSSENDDICHIIVTRHSHPKMPELWAWGYTAYSRSGLALHRFGVDGVHMLPPSLEGDVASPSGPFQHELTDQDRRTSSMLGRLIINACLAFSDPENVKSREPRQGFSGRHNGKMRTSEEPTARTYVLGKPVVHDFRETVRSFLRGDRKTAPSVQVLVSGHYKMQPHGPKNSLRKLIWREPFWRGPEDAPIPIRAHKIGGSS